MQEIVHIIMALTPTGIADSNMVDLGKFAAYYKGGYALFNEYMTWAVFSLYARENYTKEGFKQINKRVERQMMKYRSFTRFAEFNQMELQPYQSTRIR